MSNYSTKSFKLENVFNSDEITLLKKGLDKLPNTITTWSENLVNYSYLNAFDKNHFVYPLIKKVVINKLEDKLKKKIQVSQGFYWKTRNAAIIHTDYGKTFGDEKNPSGNYLIPFTEGNTHTIVFNEECTDSFEEYIQQNKELENNATHLFNDYCTHETYERLKYVSLLNIYKWDIGSVIHWDRKLLHCSDNFLNNGLLEKSALLLFTNND